ncbi:hypothetical protein AL714_17970 [Clostridium botulinum]|uniref:hypothetical protein n=1 Tax=Clostridium botulinum TaxID=1491 RepID=UPI00099DBEFE|nr:hypothetical protein [Clostridium botulinum]OPD33714.1 hypothetical protein AL714_17970 [Clostridium botulinum]
MCAKNSSPIIKLQITDINNNIVEILQNLNNREANASYILKKINYNPLIVYKSIHELLDSGVLEKIYASICPICNNENKSINENGKVKCAYCNEIYNIDFNYEKFKLKKDY